MLTPSHLAVLRAALQFWDEEMSPHDPAVDAAYFDEPIGDGQWIKPAITYLRTQFATCQLRYAACSPDGETWVSPQFFLTPEEARKVFPSETAAIATVLIFPETG